MANVTVFCAGSSGNHPAHIDSARRLGTAIASRGHTVVYGGASGGLMGILAEAALAAGGRVIGILPQVLEKREIGHPRLTELRIVASMAERKNLLLDMADAVVALPGGLGTLDELFEAATWAQIGLKSFPIGAVNIDGYYDHLFAFLDRAANDGLLQLPYRGLVKQAPTPEAVLDLLGVV